jgi:hypothetical protein
LLVVPFNFIIQKKINYEVKLSTNPFLFLSSFGFAQGFDVGGVVKETGSGLPIPGVNIQVKKYNYKPQPISTVVFSWGFLWRNISIYYLG